MPIPTLPETYKPFAGGVELLPIETPPLLATRNFVEPFTCALKEFWPEELFTCNLAEGAVEFMPTRPELLTRMRSKWR